MAPFAALSLFWRSCSTANENAHWYKETIQKRVLVLLLSLLMYPLGMPNRGDGQELKRIDHQSMKAILSHELLS